jgi:hypothetical protein
VQRETGTIFLPTVRRIDVAALARACAPPWRRWSRGAIARAERTADGRVHLVVVRARRGGVTVTVHGVGAREAEVLAPIAARVRRALPAGRGPGLRGTTPFEDAVATLLDDAAPAGARSSIARLGRRCAVAPALRTMPEPAALRGVARARLARCLGSTALARRVQALARAFAAMAPCPPTRS